MTCPGKANILIDLLAVPVYFVVEILIAKCKPNLKVSLFFVCLQLSNRVFFLFVVLLFKKNAEKLLRNC